MGSVGAGELAALKELWGLTKEPEHWAAEGRVRAVHTREGISLNVRLLTICV